MKPPNYQPLYERISTGPLRRRPIELHIAQLVDDIKEQGEGVLSVVYLDVDGFSRIEKEHGYQLADALLEEIGAALNDVDGPELSAKYVRDSFLMAYNGYTLEEAFFEAEQVRRKLSDTVFDVMADEDKRADIQVTFSAGVATFPGETEDRHELIGMAEDAARQSYANGGNRMTFGRAMNMSAKTSHYPPTQLERLRALGQAVNRSDASLLREALDDLLRKYDQRDVRRGGV